MKLNFTIIICILWIFSTNAQSAVNSGAVSNTDLIYSVGELFVIPTNNNEINSGTIGSVSIIEFNALSIDEIQTAEKFRFYPNPTKNTLFLEARNLDLKSIWIYDATGKLVIKNSILNNKVDVSALQTGIYLVKINNDNSQTFKIIKK